MDNFYLGPSVASSASIVAGKKYDEAPRIYGL